MSDKKLTLKLTLKKETLRELTDRQLGVLDQVVGGTDDPPPCPCTAVRGGGEEGLRCLGTDVSLAQY